MPEGVQPGFAIWLTGLPSSGKTAIARALKYFFLERGVVVQVLDYDELRQRMIPRPTQSPEEEDPFYNMIIFIAGLLTDNGVNVIIAVAAPRRTHRDKDRDRIQRFAEVYLECPQDVCQDRDSKWRWQQEKRVIELRCHGLQYPMKYQSILKCVLTQRTFPLRVLLAGYCAGLRSRVSFSGG
jgi:adenylylsulfate kinase